ncbi:MAG: hypothetical protein KGH55_01540 [Nanoarchaeota archaeon]|nr:hypothetical protein [Nanoarchaeota archaeon]
MPKKEMMNCCRAHTWKGVWMIVVGVLILINVFWPFLDWGIFAGALFVLAGIWKLLTPHRYH